MKSLLVLLILSAGLFAQDKPKVIDVPGKPTAPAPLVEKPVAIPGDLQAEFSNLGAQVATLQAKRMTVVYRVLLALGIKESDLGHRYRLSVDEKTDAIVLIEIAPAPKEEKK